MKLDAINSHLLS